MPNPYLADALRKQQEKRKRLDAEAEGYQALYVPDLTAEIDRRNQGRDEADLIAPPSGARKADLIKALEADDNRHKES